MKQPQRYLITAALPYANGPLHIGHIAGAYLPADIFVRYLRLNGKDVKFICGSDEHGVPITIRAKKEGITPQQVVDKYHALIKSTFEKFGISFDHYSRTSSKIHHKTASDFFNSLYEKKIFTEQETEQYYDETAGQFLADRYITGTCPKCSNPNAYGDQCEKCGTSLSPQELIEPKSTLSGNKPVKRKTKNWFLPLDKMQPDIEKYIESHHSDWKPNVYGQCKSWLNEKLQPRAMTRDLDWGVKLPNDIENAEGKVLYVWFDAPIGYISATKELLPDSWEDYWKKNDSRLIHFIGKDNIVFHCIIFPAMLKAHGDFIVPENVPANEFLNLEGDKISTSRNWAVWLHEYLEEFPGREDELRYVLCSIAPETKDSEFTWKDYQARVNNELADILGNYIKRVIDLSQKYCSGIVPEDLRGEAYLPKTNVNSLWASIAESSKKYDEAINGFKFRDALSATIDIARAGNKYLADTEPWKLIKSDAKQVDFILHESLQVCLYLSYYLMPFLPKTARKILTQLNVSESGLMNLKTKSPEGFRTLLHSGHKINSSEIIFTKISDEEINKQIDKLKATANNNVSVNKAIPTEKQVISFEDFTKLDIRVATITEAEKVPKADRLLKLKIDTGVDIRTVVSGIAAFYNPEKIIGQKVTVLLNLAPRKIKGIESQGMILMAENENGELSFVSPEKEVKNGSSVK